MLRALRGTADAGRRVKAQDGYLSSSEIWASYPTDYLPPGRNASPQKLLWC